MLSDNIKNHLSDALNESNRLALIELEAIELVNQGNIGAAKELIFSQEYDDSKGEIYNHINLFKDAAIERIEERSSELTVVITSKSIYLSSLVLVYGVVVLVSLYLIFRGERKIIELSNIDELTKIGNRKALFEFKNLDSIKYCLFIDLDNFKSINDTFGHSLGDKILVEVATRLTSIYGLASTYRISGDEFVILLKEEVTSEDMISMIKKINLPIFDEVHNKRYYIGCSVGVTKRYDNISSISNLIEVADITMYKSKKNNPNSFLFSTNEMVNEYIEKRILEGQYLDAIKNGGIFPNFQGLFNAKTNAIIGLEALARLKYKDKVILPSGFLQLIIDSGDIYALDMEIATKSMEFLAELRGKKLVDDVFYISVNFTAKSIQTLDVDLLLELIQINGLRNHNIQIELTERDIVTTEVIRRINSLISLGFKVAIDDFTAGYSSVSYLKVINASTIKIDKDVVPKSFEDKTDIDIFDALVNLSKAAGRLVLVEGIETAEQLEIVGQSDIDLVQGYLYHKPCTKSEIIKFIVGKNTL